MILLQTDQTLEKQGLTSLQEWCIIKTRTHVRIVMLMQGDCLYG